MSRSLTIVFATPLSQQGSTNIGRVKPLAAALAERHDVHMLVLGDSEKSAASSVHLHTVGIEPFTRTAAGKKRLRGFALVFNMLSTAFKTATTLRRLKPDVVVIVKPLPSNVLGVYLWRAVRRLYQLQPTNYNLILDVDDFELTANQLSSIWQRAAIHWSERIGASLAATIVTASPFLSDHFKQLTGGRKPVEMIPTGLSVARQARQVKQAPTIAYFGSLSISSGHRVDLLPEILAAVRKEIPNAGSPA